MVKEQSPPPGPPAGAESTEGAFDVGSFAPALEAPEVATEPAPVEAPSSSMELVPAATADSLQARSGKVVRSCAVVAT